MKASIRPSKKEIERVSRTVFDMQVAVYDDNNAMMLEALNEEFGFGADRLRRVMKRFNAISDRYTQASEDGFTDKEIREMHINNLKAIGIDPEDVYAGNRDFDEVMANKRYTAKNHTVSFAEAAKAAEHMAAMKQFLSDNRSSNLILTTGEIKLH